MRLILRSRALSGYTLRASNGYTTAMATKNVGLRIRVERTLGDDFLAACRAEDKPTAQVVREFMRRFVAGRPTSARRPYNRK